LSRKEEKKEKMSKPDMDNLERSQVLEDQVDDMLKLYDAAEKLYPYSNLHGEATLNED